MGGFRCKFLSERLSLFFIIFACLAEIFDIFVALLEKFLIMGGFRSKFHRERFCVLLVVLVCLAVVFDIFVSLRKEFLIIRRLKYQLVGQLS